MSNYWDFYKPNLSSEYPEVDGPETLQTYLGCLDKTYDAYRQRAAKLKSGAANGATATPMLPASRRSRSTTLTSPFPQPLLEARPERLRSIALQRLPRGSQERKVRLHPRQLCRARPQVDHHNKDVEKAFAAFGKEAQQTKLEPGMDTVRRCGNMYTARSTVVSSRCSPTSPRPTSRQAHPHVLVRLRCRRLDVRHPRQRLHRADGQGS